MAKAISRMTKASTHTAPASSATVRLMPARLSAAPVNRLRARTAAVLRTWLFSFAITWSMS